jgi:hypothetical protein
MSLKTELFGFPPAVDYRYSLHGEVFFVKFHELRSLKVLQAMYYSLATHTQGSSLLFLRPQIRKIEKRCSRALLTQIISKTQDPLMQMLAIWMRGRLGFKVWVDDIYDFYGSAHIQFRKIVVRSLRRMGAWEHLDAVVARESHPQIRELASLRATKDYSERLAKYASRIQSLEIHNEPMPLYVSPDVEIALNWRIKSAAFIRHILKRIRLMLRRYKES